MKKDKETDRQPEELAQLRESEEQLRCLSENLAEGMVYQINSGVDGKERRFTYISPAVERLHGLKVEDVLKNPLLLYNQIVEEDRLLVAQLEAHAHETRSKFEVDVRVLLPSGELRWRRFTSAPRVSQDGSLMWDGIEIDITEQKRAEDALRQNEKRWRSLIETSAAWIWATDADMKHTYTNAFVTKYLGYEPDEFLSLDTIALIHPDDHVLVKQLFEDAVALKTGWRDQVLRWKHKDGSWRCIESSGTPLLDATGDFIGLHGLDRDITERRQAEGKLRESEAMLRQSQRVANVGHYIYDISSDSWSSSEMLDEIFGIDEGYLKNTEGWLRVVYPDQRNEMSAYLSDHVIRKGNPFDKEYRIKRIADSSVRWVRGLGNLEFDASGKPVKMFGVIQDITEQRTARDQLSASEKRFRTIVERAAGGILVAEADTKEFLFANPEICRMLGYSREELLRLSIPDIHPAEEMQAVFEGVQKQLAGTLLDVETKCRRKDGSLIHVSIRSVPLEMDGRKCLLGFFTDMTERHLLEEERMKTTKLEATGLLAGGIAHDFNNLLQGIFGYIAMAKTNLEDKEHVLEMLGQAEKALHLSVNLTTQLLTFSKGGRPLKNPLKLRPVIENSVKFALSGSRTDYCLDIAEDLLVVEADEGQIAQVIQNIVLNADQAMPLGGTVHITANNVPSGQQPVGLSGKGEYVEITVRDTGVGIPKQYLSSIFDPYFTTKEKGSGIGLATTYSIIKNHGGLIEVESEVGKGSVFHIFLPGIEVKRPALTAQQAPPVVRSGRVLVMDDDELLRTLAGQMLTVLGQKVDCVPDGEKAIGLYRAAMESGNTYDVVILDLTIRGGMGGEETVRRLLAIDPHVKAVVSSGYSEDSIMSEYRMHGFSACLKKPFRLEALQEVLNSLLT